MKSAMQPTILTNPKSKTVESAMMVVVTPTRKIKPVRTPRREMGVPKIFENGELVAPSQLKKLLISHKPPDPIPCGKWT